MRLELSEAHRLGLLATARSTLEAALRGDTVTPPPAEPVVDMRVPAFVTLFAGTALRGCTGALHGDLPLSRLVSRLTISTAFGDPRFPSVTPAELPSLRFEISVLGEMRRVAPDDVEIGLHGVLVRRGRRRGLLLPQVANEHGFGREQFLIAACRKAGLPAAAYLERATTILVFEADVFGDA
jgi:AmmeMemoRadiSam system protein A